jgi:hypothetical protein
MYPFEYCVSLRVRHPNMDPQQISTVLCMQPKTEWKAGTLRQTPTGQNLEGVYEHTYWCADLHDERRVPSQDRDLSLFLEEVTEKLVPHRAFLASIHASGGSIEYFIGLFGDKNFGEIIPSSLLNTLGQLHVDIALDIYPDDKQSR